MEYMPADWGDNGRTMGGYFRREELRLGLRGPWGLDLGTRCMMRVPLSVTLQSAGDSANLPKVGKVVPSHVQQAVGN